MYVCSKVAGYCIVECGKCSPKNEYYIIMYSPSSSSKPVFTFMHLADTFIQSYLHCISRYIHLIMKIFIIYLNFLLFYLVFKKYIIHN